MALAFLSIEATSANAVEAKADIGSNSHFEFLVGRRDPSQYQSRWGDDDLAEVSYRSGVRSAPQSLNPLSRTFRFSVPLRHFDRDHPDLQLLSYADSEGNGTARSRVFRVAPLSQGGRLDMAEYEHGPPRMMSLGDHMADLGRSMGGGSGDLSASRPVRRIPLSFQESALSRAQFVDGLLQVFQAVAPSLLQALPQLIRSIGGNGSGGSGSEARSGLDTDALVALLRQVVEALPRSSGGNGGGEGTTAAPGPPPPPPPPAEAASMRRHIHHPLGHMTSERRYAASLGARRIPYAHQMDGGVLSGPMLAALLGPLLQQAPQLLGVLADKPLDFLSTIIRAEAENDLQRERNQQAFIRGLLAETNRSLLLDQLMQNMGGGGNAAALLPLLSQTASNTDRPRAEPSQAVKMRFVLGKQMEIDGKLKSVFSSQGNGIALRFILKPMGETPKAPLPRAIADLSIADPGTGQALLRKSFRLREIHTDKPVPLFLEDDALTQLPRHRDLHVSVSLRWPGAQGRVLGVRGHHAICLVDGLVFAGFGRTGTSVLHLSDPTAHRAFWNKIWEGSSAADPNERRWEIDVLCRYYIRATGKADSNGRMETRIAPTASGDTATKIAGRMRAGMELSLDMLNDALALQSDPLDPEELSAIKHADLRAALDMEATTRLRLRGKDHELGTIWAFPSLMMREALFREPMAHDDFGQVTEMRDRTRLFPVPDRIHFLPMKTKG
ncbi:hypothetical protein [Thetidibacter halocola]|uniref:Uncharacterized protein n=1 Tax=Thetidibacter halocola TaxID=2827239 RepID=A0A8J8B8P7_9RHOB|nr:hypothetical protein [Thetidibacter halocola]MBS0124999.1 hypothetical protein [Thetidibacter halocola]